MMQAVKPKKKGSRTVTLIFYTAYILLILFFLAGIFLARGQLETTLREFEESHLDNRAKIAFTQLFSQPDWEELYHLAGLEDSPYEGSAAYAAYMKEKVGTDPLTYIPLPREGETEQRYQVLVREEVLGTFTLRDERQPASPWPDWQLHSLSMVMERDITLEIWKLDSQTVTINGVALDDSFTVQKDFTMSRFYLPGGTQGITRQLQRVTGLLTDAEVAVTDQEGNRQVLKPDRKTGVYYAILPQAQAITPEAESLALETANAYALYKLRSASRDYLKLYFHPNRQAYRDLVNGDYWFEKAGNYKLFDPEITHSQAFGEDLFYAQITLKARFRPTKEETQVDAAFYFQRINGQWTCYAVALGDGSYPVSQVRVDFVSGEKLLHSVFVSDDARRFPVPTLTAPEGQRFLGWIPERNPGLLLLPDEKGILTLPEDFSLKPMTFTAVFEPI